MARNFRRQRSIQPIAELNVTNLIDLGFLLLVIFMIASPLLQKEETIPVQLPTLSQAPQQKADPDDRFVAVGVDAKGNYYVDNRNVALSEVELRTRLRAFAAESNPPVIRIRGDEAAQYGKVALLFNEMERAGLRKFTIDYNPRN
jgi:biopolymer transport protein ExbD